MNLVCPISGINIPRFILASIIAFAFVFGFEWVFHGIFLRDEYLLTPDLWRNEEEMQSYFHWMLIAQFAFSALIVMIYALFGKKYNLAEGLRLGLVIGLLLGLSCASAYIYMPISIALAAYWFAAAAIETTVVGVIAAIFYKPAPKKL